MQSACKECGGSGICIHGRQRNHCKKCGGASICKHGRQRNQCKECGGSAFCIHGRQRKTCKECGGASICIHNRQRQQCKECGGASICEHGRLRHYCKECGGSGICEHGRARPHCKECGGSALCKLHGKHHCIPCGNAKMCPGGNASEGCPYGVSVAVGEAGKKYDQLCVRCFCAAFPNDERAKQAKAYLHAREQTVMAALAEAFPQYRWTFDRAYAVGHRQRPDARAVLQGATVVFVEVDEDSHRGYDCPKERSRERIFADHTPKRCTPVMVRFNPDAYEDYDGNHIPSCFKYNRKSGTTIVDPKRAKDWQERLHTLFDTIWYVADPGPEGLPPPQPERHMLTVELFYDDIAGTVSEQDLTAITERNKHIGRRRAARREAARV
jgi:hypothetical protein